MPRKDSRHPWEVPAYESYVERPQPVVEQRAEPEDAEWHPDYSKCEERGEDEIEELMERSTAGGFWERCTGAVNDTKPINYRLGPHDLTFGVDDHDDRAYGLDGEEFEPADPDEDEFADHH